MQYSWGQWCPPPPLPPPFAIYTVVSALLYPHKPFFEMKVNVTYAEPADGAATQLPEGTQSMIGSYQVTGVAEFAKQMEEEGGLAFGASALLVHI